MAEVVYLGHEPVEGFSEEAVTSSLILQTGDFYARMVSVTEVR